jgi:hypothetical protein
MGRSKLKPQVIKILKEFDLDPRESLWDCHGTWILYHTAVQTIQHKLGITFGEPKTLFMDMEKKMVVIQVFAQDAKGNTRFEIGEACPYNNKNGYPTAMAVKRAEDKAVIHLARLREHGIYSTEEADEFKSKPKGEERVTADRVKTLLKEATTVDNIKSIVDHHRDDLRNLPVSAQRDIIKLRDNQVSKIRGE